MGCASRKPVDQPVQTHPHVARDGTLGNKKANNWDAQTDQTRRERKADWGARGVLFELDEKGALWVDDEDRRWLAWLSENREVLQKKFERLIGACLVHKMDRACQFHVRSIHFGIQSKITFEELHRGSVVFALPLRSPTMWDRDYSPKEFDVFSNFGVVVDAVDAVDFVSPDGTAGTPVAVAAAVDVGVDVGPKSGSSLESWVGGAARDPEILLHNPK